MGLFKRQLRESKPMTVVGDGEQRRDFTYIDDVVSANLLAAEKIEVHGIINIGTGQNYSINDLTRMIGGRERCIEHIVERVGETRITLADNTRARLELGWEPKVSLVDVINNY